LTLSQQGFLCAYILQVVIASVPIMYSRFTHRHLRNYGLKATKQLLVQGVSLSVGIGICLGLIGSPSTPTPEWLLLSCLLAPICEEFFFRGFLQTHAMESMRGGKKILKFHLSYGLILTALIFGAIHLLDVFLLDLSVIHAIINASIVMLLGLLIGYVYQETYSILTPIVMHSCLNGLSLISFLAPSLF